MPRRNASAGARYCSREKKEGYEGAEVHFPISFLPRVREASQPSEVPPIATAAITSKPRGDLGRDECTQKSDQKGRFRKFSSDLEILESLDWHREPNVAAVALANKGARLTLGIAQMRRELWLSCSTFRSL